MAGKTTTTSLDFAFKKLMGKANTSNLKSDAQETIGSNIQVGATTVFGVSLPSSPTQSLYTVQDECVEYVVFDISPISGTTYDADDPGGGGDESSDSGAHGYALALTGNYQALTNNTKAGTYPFTNGRVLSGSAGSLQVVPEFFSSDSPNPYTITLWESDGSGGIGDQIPLLDEVDWMLDTFSGVLFVQDYNSGKVPAYAKGFLYTGDMMSSLTSSDGSGTPFPSNVGITGSLEVLAGISGSLTHLSDGTSYLVAGSGITIASASNGSITITNDGTVGDITGVTAGTGLTGGGTSGTVTLNVDNSVVATLSGSQFSGGVGITGSLGVISGITGSITRLPDGAAYLSAGSNVTITSASNGQIVIAASTSGGTFTRDKQSYDVDATVTADTNYTVSTTSFGSGSYNPKYIDIYVNGMLLHSGTTSQVSAGTQDYAVTGDKTIKFAFDLVPDDSLDTIVTNAESAAPAGNTAQYVTWEAAGALTNSKILTGSGINISQDGGNLLLKSDPYRVYYDITGSHEESSPVTIPGARFSSNSYDFDKTEVFLNGVLMTSGSGRDYLLAGTANQVTFNFDLETNDTIIVKLI